MEDCESDWKILKDACRFMQVLGGTANKTCGGHIHIGANTLGVDKKAWEYFLKIWSEAEPLIYMISNRRGEKTREKASLYARPASEAIDNIFFESINLKNTEDVESLARKVSSNNRYKGLNLINVHSKTKNTIEFRLPNGTLDYNIWRENILLFGRMIQVAKSRSIIPTFKEKEYNRFFESDLSEKEKVVRFLNLVFDDEKEKDIYMQRWRYRAGEKPVFKENSVPKYKRQKFKESIKEQISIISEEVSDTERIEAMQVLIGENRRQMPQKPDIDK